MEGRETNKYRDFLRIMMGTRLAQIEYIKQLKSTPHTYEDLLQLATTVGNSGDSNDINNALVMRRKAIQMWMLKGMSREEFVEQKKIVRRIVANLGEDNFNVVRAEMVIISLQRLMEAIKWKEP
ncbi:hypothetical protein H0H93_000725 [Arthromyces matolae]|nr:hypothetical protein H0H93_000725 [Arthromyces matolae]